MEAEKAMQELAKLRYTAEELERKLVLESKRRAAAEDDAKVHVAKARSLERELENEVLSLTPALARSRSRGDSGKARSNQGKLADRGKHSSSSSSSSSSTTCLLRTRPARSLVISSPTLTPRQGRSEENRRLNKNALTGDRKASNSKRLHPG